MSQAQEPSVNTGQIPTSPLVGLDSRPADHDGCRGTTRLGNPCKATVMAHGGSGGPWCINHAPAVSDEQRSAWRRHGGLVRVKETAEKRIAELTGQVAAVSTDDPGADFSTAASTRTYLERQATRLANGKIGPSQAGGIAQLAGLAVKLAELQLERDLLDLELESADKPRGRRR